MNVEGVRRQLEDLIGRLIASSVAVKQFYPKVKAEPGGSILIGRPTSSAIAMRDVDYGDIYRELDTNEAYDIKLVDGGLLIFQYQFDRADTLLKHRLAYFPCPTLPTVDESPSLYEEDELFGDIMARSLVRFPIRFDYAPDQYRDVVHPASHMTLGQYENCRIPVAGPLGPYAFGIFIVRNFYCRAYTRNKNKFDRSSSSLKRTETISQAERRVLHLVQN